MLAASNTPVVPTVNNTALPPGRICAQRWLFSPLCKSVTGVGGPPAEGILHNPPFKLSGATMLPSSPQLPPGTALASHNMIGEPPSTEIFCSFPFKEKPTHCPSGEKKGAFTP